MGKKTGTGVSLTDTDWEHVNNRISALKLSSIAEYFELVVDYDRVFMPRKFLHRDNSVHLFPEDVSEPIAAEPPAGVTPPKIDHLANAAAAERALAEPPRSKARRTRAKH